MITCFGLKLHRLEDLSMTTGEKIAKLRKENNYTQEDLADIMGVSRQSISKWEGDQAFPETEKLIALARLFRCSLDYLLNNEIEAETKNEEKKAGFKFKKTKLPLLITEASVILVTLILFAFTAFTFTTTVTPAYPGSSGTQMTFTFYSNYYEFMFFKVWINNNQWPNTFALLAFISIIAIIIVSTCYVFFDKKGLLKAIHVLNFVVPALILVSIMSCPASWKPAPYLAFAFYLALAICQYAVKPLKRA